MVLGISFKSFSAALFLIDLSMLPVYHFFGLPLKVSYFLAAYWIADYFFLYKKTKKHKLTKDIHFFVLIFIFLIGIAFLGEILLSLHGTVADRTPAYINFAILVTIAGSVLIGASPKTKITSYFLPALLVYCSINLVFTLFPNHFSRLIDIYFQATDGVQWEVDLVRPRGILGNPNATLTVMNVLLMGVIVFLKKKLIKISLYNYALILIFTVLTSIVINSRGESINTIILLFYLFYSSVLYNIKGFLNKTFFIILFLASLVTISFVIENSLTTYFPHVTYSINRYEGLYTATGPNNDGSVVVNRLTYAHEGFMDRFRVSPIFGTGFSIGSTYPTNRWKFHNDFRRALINFGLIGFILWILLFYRVFKLGGWIMLLFLFTTGLSNAFLVALNSISIYFLVVGILIKTDKKSTK